MGSLIQNLMEVMVISNKDKDSKSKGLLKFFGPIFDKDSVQPLGLM